MTDVLVTSGERTMRSRELMPRIKQGLDNRGEDVKISIGPLASDAAESSFPGMEAAQWLRSCMFRCQPLHGERLSVAPYFYFPLNEGIQLDES